MKEYIIHGTVEQNLENILKDGYITPNNEKADTLLSKSPNQIFTQLVYRNIPGQEIDIQQRPFYGNCAIVLDKQILKDYPFYACTIGSFHNNFNNVFESNDTNILYKSHGKLERMPNLKKLKNHINNYMKKSENFTSTHEILFNKKISLKKYCLCIIYTDNYISDNIINLSNKLKIPIKQFPNVDKFFYPGMNKFIDLIES